MPENTRPILEPDSAQILARAETFVLKLLEANACGHDFWHIQRVRQLALRIAPEVGAEPFMVELAALLHDVADPKLNVTPEQGVQILSGFLDTCAFSPERRAALEDILARVSFSGELDSTNSSSKSPELMAVQDADRLDALGAVGIARTFAYGGSRGNAMHEPETVPRKLLNQTAYRTGRSTSINHFHEKLLKLKAKMNTATGRALAEDRHEFMVTFLAKFQREWDGKE
jgi:uncharacterized protein